MRRREFMKQSATAVGGSAAWWDRSADPNLSAASGNTPTPLTPDDLSAAAREAGRGKRVALIGCGWYGKCDLLRLIQVADVQVVALCDVDRKMLGQAAEIVAQRQLNRQKPQLFEDYRELLAKTEVDLVLLGKRIFCKGLWVIFFV